MVTFNVFEKQLQAFKKCVAFKMSKAIVLTWLFITMYLSAQMMLHDDLRVVNVHIMECIIINWWAVANVARGSWAVQMNLLVHKMKVVMLTNNVLTSPPVRWTLWHLGGWVYLYWTELRWTSQCMTWSLQMNLLIHKIKGGSVDQSPGRWTQWHLGGTRCAPDGQLRSGQVQSRSLCPNTHVSVTWKCKIFTTTQWDDHSKNSVLNSNHMNSSYEYV